MGSKMSLKRAAELCAQPFTIEYPDGSESIWIQTRTDQDIRAMQEAIVKDRLAIRDRYRPGTDHYQALVATIELSSVEELVAQIIDNEEQRIRERAERGLPRLMPFEDGKFKNEEDRRRAEIAHEDRVKALEEKIDEKMRELAAARETQLLAMPKDDLVRMAIEPQISYRIDSDTMGLVQDYVIYDSIRDGEDHDARYFDSVEDVASLPPTVKAMLMAAITEVANIRPCDIKNGQGRSVMPTGPAETTPEPTEVLSTTD